MSDPIFTEGIQADVSAGGMAVIGVGMSSSQSITGDVNYSTGGSNICAVNTTCVLVGPMAGATSNASMSLQTGTLTRGDTAYSIGLTGSASVLVGGKVEVSLWSNGSVGAGWGKELGGALGGAVKICRQTTSASC